MLNNSHRPRLLHRGPTTPKYDYTVHVVYDDNFSDDRSSTNVAQQCSATNPGVKSFTGRQYYVQILCYLRYKSYFKTRRSM